jgi:hypothetical protein
MHIFCFIILAVLLFFILSITFYHFECEEVLPFFPIGVVYTVLVIAYLITVVDIRKRDYVVKPEVLSIIYDTSNKRHIGVSKRFTVDLSRIDVPITAGFQSAVIYPDCVRVLGIYTSSKGKIRCEYLDSSGDIIQSEFTFTIDDILINKEVTNNE